ncbi:FHA domain-containing protein [Leptolinea tardivitalis]|uniref:FHA domain-containing protein n=1 Tax=Leptolinea tardivitalis TaxID=229920 RepID=UPI0007866C9A|nr:FHA domain-containing protein [Leptolinea tardivitalis]GAP20815.1 protein containing FOG: FHA domain [Leptolinea tardivitalis]
MSATYQLVIRSGAGAGKVLPLDKTELHVGRDVTNDLVISDEKVSRRHARLYTEGDQYVVEDLGSTNGTFINGARLSGPHLLRAGEQITFGETSIVSYERIEGDPNATVMSTISSSASAPNMVPPPAAIPQPHKQPQQSYIAPDVPLARDDFEAAPPRSAPKKKTNTLLIVIVIIIVLFICLCGVIFWMIDSNNLYCTIAPSLFPGCPTP